MNKVPGSQTDAGGAQKAPVVNEWLKLARDADERSTGYFDNNYRKTWENDLRMFNSKHPADSKYNTDAYRFRSRVFRPKSRAVLRKNEATAALAFFSNPDVINVQPEDEEDPVQIASADVMKELLQYRLTKTIPWFLTAIGGFQDAMNVGLVCSLQYWDYQAEVTQEDVTGFHPMLGEITVKMPKTTIKVDRPRIELFPIENVRFDPAAAWYDVVETSPYLILKIPMYVSDILDRMENTDRQGNKWRRISKQRLLEAKVDGLDPMRQARTNNAEDAQSVTSEVNEFEVVMVHLNFITTGGDRYAYYTLQTKELLSDPIPVSEMFLHCKDNHPPVVIGFCVIETHKPVPSSLVGLTGELQREANEIANQRLDNVKYVLNKRSLVRRGSNVDVESLLRNVPGGVTMVNDVERDIREVNWPDVTSSSYQEQDRVNVDFDELAGSFGQGSVLTNRRLNETVGGMKLMTNGANVITEYTIRTYVESWMEKVIRQMAKMEQAYETDEVVLAVASKKAKIFQKFGRADILDHLLAQDLTLSVSVGMGATDPDARFQKFVQASGAYAQISQAAPPDMNLVEVRKTLYGLAGFRDAAKFFNPQVDPQVAKAMKMAQMAQGEAQKMIDGEKDRLLQRDRTQDVRDSELDLREFMMKLQNEFDRATEQFKQRVASAKLSVQETQAVSAVNDLVHNLEMRRKDVEHYLENTGNQLETARQEIASGQTKREQDHRSQLGQVMSAFAKSHMEVTGMMKEVVDSLNKPKKMVRSPDGTKMVVPVE